MMKKIIVAMMAMLFALDISAQVERPKLVVGVVVDQMRWDYLYRYYDDFGTDGLRKLMDKGFSCENHFFSYVPTVTAAGHASVYTGTTPAIHGIAGNNFWINGKNTYCAEDSSVKPVGSDNAKAGSMSPRNMLSSTIGDQLRLATRKEARVYGVAYKDRAAILPAGHLANGAFWYDSKNRKFITSTYYMDKLPEYVEAFNKAHNFTDTIATGIEGLKATTDLGIAIMKNEELGKRNTTDMLCVSYSATDAVGHTYGIDSWRIDQIYLALDKEIARLTAALDKQVGKGNYLLFLSSDHAGAHSAKFLVENGMHGGEWNWIKHVKPSSLFMCGGYNFMINREEAARRGLSVEHVKDSLMQELAKDERIEYVVDLKKVSCASIPEPIKQMIIKGYNPQRSGDIYVIMRPGYYYGGEGENLSEGTNHGAWNPYDSHAPLLYYGWNIEEGGRTNARTHVEDIAATVCALLHIQMPNGCIGNAIVPVMGR